MTSEERSRIYKEKVEPLLKEKNVTMYKVSADLGESASMLPRWRDGICMPKPERMKKIADYFGKSIDYFYGGD